MGNGRKKTPANYMSLLIRPLYKLKQISFSHSLFIAFKNVLKLY